MQLTNAVLCADRILLTYSPCVVGYLASRCSVSCLQTTSLFLHWFPACVAWTERWHPDVHVREYNKKSSGAMAEWHEASLLDLVVLPMIPYLVWALLYYVKVCCCLLSALVGSQYRLVYMSAQDRPLRKAKTCPANTKFTMRLQSISVSNHYCY